MQVQRDLCSFTPTWTLGSCAAKDGGAWDFAKQKGGEFREWILTPLY